MATTLDIPQIINQPFANGGDRATLPETSAIPGQASISEGIPPECSLPIASGGAYTNRTDANALGYLATSLQYYMQNGGAYTFSATVATAIGGYPAGARLWTSIGGNPVIVRSLVDNNSLDPSSNIDDVNWTIDMVSPSYMESQSTRSTSGYQILTGGLIIQWGTDTVGAGSTVTVTPSIPFPNVLLNVTCTIDTISLVSTDIVGWDSAASTTNSIKFWGSSNADGSIAGAVLHWFAVGY